MNTIAKRLKFFNMKRMLSSNGNSWHLYLNKPLAQLMGITSQEYTVLLHINNKVLYVNKIDKKDIDNYKDLLCKKLIKRSAGYGLNLPLPILEMLEINPETDMVDYEINGQVLSIRKAD